MSLTGYYFIVKKVMGLPLMYDIWKYTSVTLLNKTYTVNQCYDVKTQMTYKPDIIRKDN